MRHTTKADKILIVLLVVGSLLAYGMIFTAGNDKETKYISIQVDGKEISRVQMTPEMVGKQYVIQTEFGRNVIEVGDDFVHVIEADCPDKLDVKQGKISRVGEVIVCLPNRLMIEIVGADEKQQSLDVINY